MLHHRHVFARGYALSNDAKRRMYLREIQVAVGRKLDAGELVDAKVAFKRGLGTAEALLFVVPPKCETCGCRLTVEDGVPLICMTCRIAERAPFDRRCGECGREGGKHRVDCSRNINEVRHG